jgi:hypothetical protein
LRYSWMHIMCLQSRLYISVLKFFGGWYNEMFYLHRWWSSSRKQMLERRMI